MLPIASIIIPTYQRNQDLYKCLDCIRSCIENEAIIDQNRIETIVSDDARDPALKREIRAHYPWVRYLNGPQKGPAANRNNGAKEATGEWLIFTDDDCLPQHQWLDSFFGSFDQAEVLEGKTIADRPQQRLDEESPINVSGGLLWSCNFAIKKSLFTEIGGFDEDFPHAAMEDVDFRIRLQKMAIPIQFVDAVIIHPWRIQHNFINAWSKRSESWKYLTSKHADYFKKPIFSDRLKMAARIVSRNLGALIKFRGKGWKAALFEMGVYIVRIWKPI